MWKHQICSVRGILASLLQTLMAKNEAVIIHYHWLWGQSMMGRVLNLYLQITCWNQIKSSDATTQSFSETRFILQTVMEKGSAYVYQMNFGADGVRNLSILSKKDKSQQQQKENSGSMLYCLKKIHQEINGCSGKLLKKIQTIKEWLGVWHCSLVLMIIAVVNKYWNVQS